MNNHRKGWKRSSLLLVNDLCPGGVDPFFGWEGGGGGKSKENAQFSARSARKIAI